MKSIARACVLTTLLIANRAGAEDQIRWAPDFRTACQLAADQHRLVLLHFYNDNCEPCVRLERNVFSQPPVAEAIAANYLPVKVHAGQDPQLASRYRVRSWPTDVFVTPTGLEVYRSNSPPKPDEYIALVNQVAQQTGVSASRQWVSKLGNAAQPAASAAADAANPAASGVRQATEQAAVTAQDNFIQGQQRWSAALDQFKAASDQARAAASQTTQQFTDGARQAQQQAAATGQQWSQQTTDAMQRYEQQGGEAYRQFRDQAAGARQDVQQQAQQFRQDARGTAEQLTDAARGSASRWEQTFSPTQPPVAVTNVAANAPTAPAVEKPASAAPPLLPTDNPWMAAQQQLASKPSAAPQPAVPAAPETTPESAPPLLPQTASMPTLESPPPTTPPAPTAPSSPSATWQSPVAQTAPPTQQQIALNQQAAPSLQPAAPPSFGSGQFVPVSQAPPVAMDGFCPVTLLETVTRDPQDKAAWRKGNAKFGAIHIGRTYLFTSPEQQQKFLANPEGYAPVLSGCDPVAFAERGELVDGKRAYGLITPDHRIFLFADEAALRKFNQSPGSYAAAAQQAMLRSSSGNVYR